MTIQEAISCLKADKEYLVDYKVCDGEEIDVAINTLEHQMNSCNNCNGCNSCKYSESTSYVGLYCLKHGCYVPPVHLCGDWERKGIIMTIQEMARIYKRICGKYSNDNCNDCPLTERKFIDADGCLNAMIQFPDEFEKALLGWVKENPAPTNRDKFFEVFGISECPPVGWDWWSNEYVEPERTE